MKKALFLYIAIFFGYTFILAAKDITVDTLSVVNIEQDHGLSQLNVLSLDFDNQGYLWIGTENGLNRFNGYNMKVFKAGRGRGELPDDHIRALYHADDVLWLATNTNSICAYLIAEDRFVTFEGSLDFDQFPGAKFTHTVTPLDDRFLLAGAIDHCILIDRSGPAFTILNISGKMDNEYVTSAVKYIGDTFLLSTNFEGTYLLDLSEKSISPFMIKNQVVNAFLNLDNERLLIGTNNGLFMLNKKSEDLQLISNPLKNEAVRSLFNWDEKSVFVGGINRNFLLTKDFRWKELILSNGLGQTFQTTVLSLKEDGQGGKWMGTEGRGVLYYHPYQKKFSPYRITANNSPKKEFISIFNLLKEGDTLWMATELGIARYLESTKQYKLYLTNKLEYTLSKDDNGSLWAGGFGEGLLRYKREKDVFENIPLPFKDKDVIQITPVSKDSLWIHTWSDGIYSFNIHNYQSQKKIIKGKSLIRSRNSFIDSENNIWLASDDGLYQISDDGEKYYDSLSNERVFAITEDPEKNIWVGTGRGLNKIDRATGKITHFTEQEGLPNDFIYGVESDTHGNIWVSTNYGISEFNPKTRVFQNYTQQDGLQNNEFNGKASYKDDAGRLYFGGMNGFNIFHPDSIFVNKNVGNTVIEDIQLFGKSIKNNIPYQDSLTFSHDQNVLTFSFVNLSFLWPEKNHYRFMLKGFDKTWRPVTKERSTTYTNLDPGSYKFKVTGSNNEMIWGNTAAFTIVIKSPWYDTAWFKTTLVVLLIFQITLVFLYRDYRQKKLNRTLSRMVDERTEELTEMNKALNASLYLTQQQKENISFLMRELNHRVKNNLQLINSLIDFQKVGNNHSQQSENLKQLQSRIFTVSRIHDLLDHGEMAEDDIQIDKFISQLAKDLVDFSGNDIGLKLDIPPLEFQTRKLTYVGLILNELITNSIKYAFTEKQENKLITIRLINKDNLLKLTYCDNGMGLPEIDQRSSKSLGLNIISVLTEELEGTLEMKSEKGAVFNFLFNTSTLLKKQTKKKESTGQKCGKKQVLIERDK